MDRNAMEKSMRDLRRKPSAYIASAAIGLAIAGALIVIDQRAAVAAAPDAYITTAQQLQDDYDANEVAVDLKIAGKPVRITGVVGGIDKDFANRAVVHLATNAARLNPQMTLLRGQERSVASLKRGAPVAIQCKAVKLFATAIFGDDCAIVG